MDQEHKMTLNYNKNCFVEKQTFLSNLRKKIYLLFELLAMQFLIKLKILILIIRMKNKTKKFLFSLKVRN